MRLAYLPILSIPVVECNSFALNSLKWLRYVGYTVYGQERSLLSLA